MRLQRGITLIATMGLMACGSGKDGSAGPAGAEGPAGAMGPMGDMGPAGAAGKDGNLRVYGDGTAGALHVMNSASWLGPTPGGPANGNYMFTDVTIDAGVTLTVESGTTIRCTGAFVNHGTLSVGTGTSGGLTPANEVPSAPGRGLAIVVATNGEEVPYAATTASRRAGRGFGLHVNEARSVLHPSYQAGGGGGASGASDSTGGRGGGAVVILAAGGITVDATGSIAAVGGTGTLGGGGGAGGFVVLASSSAITIAGTIDVSGAVGADGDATTENIAPGGGGTGGVIHLLAPTLTTSAATFAKSGGTPGAVPVATLAATKGASGGSGGALSSQAGFGGYFNVSAGTVTIQPGGPGSPGFVLQDAVDPTDML